MFEQNVNKLHYHMVFIENAIQLVLVLIYSRHMADRSTLTGECGYGGVVLPELGEAAADGEEPPAGEHHAVCSKHVSSVRQFQNREDNT